MKILVFIAAFAFLGFSPKTKAEVEFVRPEAYSIRRFSEVINKYHSTQPQSTQEKLIRQRALLSIAESELAIMRKNPTTTFKSLEARVDHHKKRILYFEEKIKKKKR